MEEEWRDIPGFPGYQVSDLGRIRSFRDRHGGIYNKVRILKPANSHHGYQRLQICRDGQRINYVVHRLVLLAFVGTCPEGKEVGHLDGDTSNNKLGNLCYCTKEENEALKVQMGTHQWVKLTPEQVHFIRQTYISKTPGHTQRDIAKQLGVSTGCISAVLTRRVWHHLP